MATLTIRGVDERLRASLEHRAARHGRSVEEEARTILRDAVGDGERTSQTDLATAIRRRFAPFGGIELSIVPRELMREPPSFEQ
jgi:antitoxin FitA